MKLPKDFVETRIDFKTELTREKAELENDIATSTGAPYTVLGPLQRRLRVVDAALSQIAPTGGTEANITVVCHCPSHLKKSVMNACLDGGFDSSHVDPSKRTTILSFQKFLSLSTEALIREIRTPGISVADKQDRKRKLEEVKSYQKFLSKIGDVRIAMEHGIEIRDTMDFIKNYCNTAGQELSNELHHRIMKRFKIGGVAAALAVAATGVGSGIYSHHAELRRAEVAAQRQEDASKKAQEAKRNKVLEALTRSVVLTEVMELLDESETGNDNEIKGLEKKENRTGREDVHLNILRQIEAKHREVRKKIDAESKHPSSQRRVRDRIFSELETERDAARRVVYGSDSQGSYAANLINRKVRRICPSGEPSDSQWADAEFKVLIESGDYNVNEQGIYLLTGSFDRD